MSKSNYALRLQKDLKAEAEQVAKQLGTTLNQFINVAIAEKLSAIRTEAFFHERASRADLPKTLRMLKRIGKKHAPRKGDEIND